VDLEIPLTDEELSALQRQAEREDRSVDEVAHGRVLVGGILERGPRVHRERGGEDGEQGESTHQRYRARIVDL